jgi:hypothetical protein
MLVHPPGHHLFFLKFRQLDWCTGNFQDIKSHRVLLFVVAPDPQPIEFDDKAQLAGENTEELFGISMDGQSLRQADYCLIASCG